MTGMTVPRGRFASHKRRHVAPTGFETALAVIIVLSLLAMAVPAYLGFKARADSAAARAHVRSAIPAIEAYFALTNDSYVGLNLAWLRQFDPSVQLNDPARSPGKQTATSYCVSATVGGKTWYKAGPKAPITRDTC
jgi:Tfp pilus assembly protein PilE